MKIQKKLLLGFLIIIAITAPNGIIGFLKVDNSLSHLKTDTKSSLDDLKTVSHLNSLTVFMRYYDELLTQAARNYAFTSDEKWAELYFDAEPKLDKTIQEAFTIGSQKEKTLFNTINQANVLLVDFEHRSIDLVREGKQSEAISLLESADYWNAKNLYHQALEEYSKDKGMEFDQTLDVSTIKIDQSITDVETLLAETQTLLFIGIPTLLMIAILLSYFISRSISRPIKLLRLAADEVSQGNYNIKFQTQSNDELDDLGQKFESMVNSFENSIETERKLTIIQERLKTEKLTAIGELSARIAHDLRNPLSVIKNVAEIIKLQYPSNDKRLQDHFTKLENSVQRMSHQIDDVLNFVRTTPLEKKITSVKEIIAKSIDDLDLPRDISIERPLTDEKIDCDEQKLRTAISNVILNAIQAIDGKGIITIKISGYTKHITIDISDSGPGIPEDVLPNIFDPLFTTRQRGTGLGLSSCKNIIEQHDGTISVRNKPTTFTITLPRI
ncbi:HAMP domain-containing histidine kinase [Candidatus Nitrosotenuis cloacae]|uniref:HAMP domain-containing histidine kinase n=1 Tax=Candidatus Nitrosotenuis cloacae TaxID=1603555 RepID=UPI00069C0806|nr:HAMP domain-containing histidine kinase [Candidatus Nitrosotenuis cloacae]